MSTPSEFSSFQSLFQVACKEYGDRTGTNIAEHPLAVSLQACDSFESLIALLQGQARAFREFRGSDGKVASGSFDGLSNLFESLTIFLRRLDIYTQIPLTAAMTEIVVNIMVELLFTLALAAKQMRQGPLQKIGHNFLGKNEIEGVLQRLDRVTQNEARWTAVQTLQIVYGLVESVKVLMDDCKASNDHIRETLVIGQQIVMDMSKSKRDQLQQDVENWLSPTDPWETQCALSKARHNGTAAWFIQSNVFTQWKTSGSLLWVQGKPGSGKSILSSAIIEDISYMQKAGLASLAFFYFDSRDNKKKDLRSLLSSLLFQLCCHQSDSYCKVFTDFYAEHRHGSQYPSDAALSQCLKDMLMCSEKSPIYIIMEGIDECPKFTDMLYPRQEVLVFLEELSGLSLSNLHICITSRPEIDITTTIHPLTSHSISLHDEAGHRKDIVDYVRSFVNSDPSMRRWRVGDKDQVILSLSRRADGMFRLVTCQLHGLRGCHPLRISYALDDVPATLDWTYERTLQDIPDAMRESTHLLLQCVLVASRPLLVEELAEFLAFYFDPGSLPYLDSSCRPEDPEDALLSTCPSLLTITEADGSRVVRFSHPLVKDFLTSDRRGEARGRNSVFHVDMTRAHTTVVRACLSVLLSLNTNASSMDNLKNFPLAAYASRHWLDHALFDDVSQHIQDVVKPLLNLTRPRFAMWISLYDPDGSLTRLPYSKGPLQTGGTPLHYAAAHNLLDLTEFLAKLPWQSINARGTSREETPLMVASEMGHVEIVRFLLARGGDANAQDKSKQTPLHWASHKGHLEVAQLLLEHHADTKTLDNNGQTPLHLAWRGGHLEVAQLLIERGADLSIRDESEQTPLHWACQEGHLEAVQLLLRLGAYENATDNDGQTPLCLALREGHLGVAERLLKEDGDPNSRDKSKQTPLHWASQEGRLEAAQLLLEHGADANTVDGNGKTPLRLALQGEHLEIIRLLLDHDGDANAQDKGGQTLLHWASHKGRFDVAQILLEHHADTKALDNNGQAPLHLALREEHLDVARLLLEHGAAVNVRDKSKQTLLHWASREGRLEVAQLLLEHHADTKTLDNNGQAPLHLALTEGHFDVARLLLEHGAAVNVQDKSKQTLLHWASCEGRLEVAQLLLEHHATTKVLDGNGQTPLHLALHEGHLEIARLLLDRGVDANVQDKSKQTLLHWASLEGRLDVVQLLLEYNADMKTLDNKGKTSLHLASREGHVEIVQLLLERGTKVNAVDSSGQTPLHMASQEGHVKVAQLLLERGADVNARDRSKRTPLHRASEEGRVEFAQLLLKQRADANARDRTKQTPLHLASASGRLEVAELLLSRSATQDHNGLFREGHLTVAELFLEQRVNVNALDSNNRTPLHWAANGGHLEIVELLLEHCAMANVQEHNGLTASELASRKGHGRIVQRLSRE